MVSWILFDNLILYGWIHWKQGLVQQQLEQSHSNIHIYLDLAQTKIG